MADMDRRELERQISEYEDGKLTRTSARDLAALYTILEHLYPDRQQGSISLPPPVSFAGPEVSTAATVPLYGDSQFLKAVAGKDQRAVWRVMDQLAETLAVVSQPLYRSLLSQIERI